jgi:peptidoglycan hydrolase CwlO-like protein
MRVKAVGELVKDTHETLSGFAGDRRRMSAQQSKDLADFVNGLSKNVQSFLGEFQKGHKQMSKEQAKSLSDFVKNLANDIGSMLSRFEKERAQMSKEVKNKLAKEIKDIQTQVERILDEADKLMGEYSSEVAQAKKAWENMSAALAKARKGGVMPRIEAGEDVSTVRQAVKKGRGKKGRTSAKKRVPAGV